jgi:hypothetical protein
MATWLTCLLLSITSLSGVASIWDREGMALGGILVHGHDDHGWMGITHSVEFIGLSPAT